MECSQDLLLSLPLVSIQRSHQRIKKVRFYYIRVQILGSSQNQAINVKSTRTGILWFFFLDQSQTSIYSFLEHMKGLGNVKKQNKTKTESRKEMASREVKILNCSGNCQVLIFTVTKHLIGITSRLGLYSWVQYIESLGGQ